MKRPAWEPMPGRIFDFTERQQILIGAIEKITDAEVIVLKPMPEFILREKYSGFLSRPQKNAEDAEYPKWREENGELSYIRNNPNTKIMSAEERLLYPEFIRREFPEEDEPEPCNVIPAYCRGDDIDQVLSELYRFTILLEMDWHLSREENYI